MFAKPAITYWTKTREQMYSCVCPECACAGTHSPCTVYIRVIARVCFVPAPMEYRDAIRISEPPFIFTSVVIVQMIEAKNTNILLSTMRFCYKLTMDSNHFLQS